MKTCLSCSRFGSCKDPHKSAHFTCKKWEPLIDRHSAYIEKIFQSSMSTDLNARIIPTSPDLRKQEFNLVELLDGLLDSESIVPNDIRVDDRDLPEFKNFYQFCFSKRGINVEPFVRQLYIAIKLFAEYCPKCSKPGIMENIENFPVDFPSRDFPENVQLLERGKCPKCQHSKSWLVRKGLLKPYSELAGLAGQRGGKSALVSLLLSYQTHKVLKLQKPTEVYGLLPNQTLTTTLVALTYQGAVELLWTPLADVIKDSTWFQEYHSLLDDAGEKYGEELYNFAETFLHYKHRKFILYPSGPNKRTLRGRTRIGSAIDELGWFLAGGDSDDAVKLSGEEIYTALDRSLLTVRAAARKLLAGGYNNVPTAYALNISSPSSAFDKITTLVTNNKHSKDIFVFHLPTWGLNPKITREDLDKEFENDPIRAERDYGANPPMATNPFIENAELVARMFTPVRNWVEYRDIHKKSKGGKVMKAAAIINLRKPTTMYPSVLALDAGYSNNSFAGVLMHREQRDKYLNLVIDAIVEVIPQKGKTYINYSKMFTGVVYPMLQQLNIGAVLADRWNSLMLLSQVEEDFPNIVGMQYSVTYDDFILVKSYLEGGRIYAPMLSKKPEDIIKNTDMNKYPMVFNGSPIDHFYFQCLTVSDTGRTVTKGPNLTDDIFRAFALGAAKLLDNEFCEEYLKTQKTSGTRGIGALASRSGGSAGSAGTIVNQMGRGVAASSNGGGIPMISHNGGGQVFSRIKSQ